MEPIEVADTLVLSVLFVLFAARYGQLVIVDLSSWMMSDDVGFLTRFHLFNPVTRVARIDAQIRTKLRTFFVRCDAMKRTIVRIVKFVVSLLALVQFGCINDLVSKRGTTPAAEAPYSNTKSMEFIGASQMYLLVGQPAALDFAPTGNEFTLSVWVRAATAASEVLPKNLAI